MGVQARHDIAASVAQLNMMAGHAAPRDLVNAVNAIRAAAQAEGRLPVVAVARAIESALARGERGVVVRGWIAMLSEAVGCESHDADSGHVFLAAGAIRLAH
ncbi:MAG: hypothetical protein V4459_06740 [Pseudomonadota bacterium]